MTSEKIISTMFPDVVWKDSSHGFMSCPGKHLHSGKNGNRDCRITINGAPTIFCLHQSCSAIVEEANYKMRRALWENKPGEKRELTNLEKDQIRKEIEIKRKAQRWEEWA